MGTEGQLQCKHKHQMLLRQVGSLLSYIQNGAGGSIQWGLDQKGAPFPAAERSKEGTHLISFRKRIVRFFLLWAVI